MTNLKDLINSVEDIERSVEQVREGIIATSNSVLEKANLISQMLESSDRGKYVVDILNRSGDYIKSSVKPLNKFEDTCTSCIKYLKR